MPLGLKARQAELPCRFMRFLHLFKSAECASPARCIFCQQISVLLDHLQKSKKEHHSTFPLHLAIALLPHQTGRKGAKRKKEHTADLRSAMAPRCACSFDSDRSSTYDDQSQSLRPSGPTDHRLHVKSDKGDGRRDTDVGLIHDAYFTSSQTFSHFFLHSNGRPHVSQTFDGRFDFV